ncbi:MAG: dTDP-4-dehydrorhamnose reductase [Acidimicrobiales bacterium]
MRVLVTGAGGQLGHDCVARFATAGHDVVGCDRSQLDAGDRDAVLSIVTTLRPAAVVHCAAWTAVDACESDPDRAFRDNALAPRWMREATQLVGAHLCHISTDYVFSGDKPVPYVEWDKPDPQSVYGRSKLAGEGEAGPDATVVRTSWVCGLHGKNMVKTILRLAGQHDRLRFVADQRGHPTFTDDLADAVYRLVIDRRAGVHHVTNQGAVSWFEFAQEVLRAAGLDPSRVEPITTAELDPPRPAPRPANSVLDNAVLRLAGLPLLADFREPLHRMVTQLV